MDQMWQAVTELPVAWRQATLLRYLTGMDLPAVVEVMERDGRLVEAMLRDALHQVSARLAEQMDDAAGSPVPRQRQPKVRQPTLADIAGAAGVNLSTLSRARSGLPISEKTRQRLAEAPGDGVADKPRVTLAEVAQRAGTSVTTASRVLRNEPQPAGVTQRVMAAIAELGYAASVYTRRAAEPAAPARWSPPRRGGGRNSSPGFGSVDAFEEPRDSREDLGLPARRRRVSGPRYGPEVFFARDPRIPRGLGARADEQAPGAGGARTTQSAWQIRSGTEDPAGSAVDGSAPTGGSPASRNKPAPRKPTGREIEVLTLVAEGRTDREIATEIGTSTSTVQRHLSNIRRKFGPGTPRAELPALVVRVTGLAPEELTRETPRKSPARPITPGPDGSPARRPAPRLSARETEILRMPLGVVTELPEHARGFEEVRVGLRPGLAALGPETFARVDAAKKELAALPGYWYISDLPMPEPGETFGADWVSKRGEWLSALFDGRFDELRDIELTEKDFLELGRIVERFPVYTTLALIVAAGLSVDQLLHIRKMGWGQLFIRQTKITQKGETTSVWKLRTMRKGNPLEPSSRKNKDKTTPVSRFARDTSLDELPQLLAIAAGTMQYFSGRPLLQKDHERMKKVLTAEEYEFWNGHLKNDLWSALHFPGCREHEPESETYLRARYLAAYIWSNIGSRAAEEYMMRIVDRYLAAVVAREAPNPLIGTVEDILRGMAGLLPGSSGHQLLDAADRVAGGPFRQIARTMRGTANRISNLVYPMPGEPEAAGFERKKMLAAIDFVEGEIAETGGSPLDPGNGTEGMGTEPVADSNTPATGALRGTPASDDDIDEPLFVVAPGARDDLLEGEPAFAVASMDPVDEVGEEVEYEIAADAQVLAHPDLAGLLPAAAYRVRGTSEGTVMSPEHAAVLRRLAVAHGEHHEGNNNRVHLLGDYAVREPKPEAVSAGNSLIADYRLWPDEYRTVEAVVRTAVRLNLPHLVARLPQILHVETDDAGNVLYEIHRRIDGQPVKRLFLPEVRSVLEDLEPVFEEVPVPQELLPLPEGYPASGDSTGFFTMLVDHLETRYQAARRDPAVGPLLRGLRLPESLAPRLAALAAQVRSQSFRLLHADITRANILGIGDDAAVLVDFGLALYGPPDFESAVLLQRDLHEFPDGWSLPAALWPFVALLDGQRILNDLVRLVQEAELPVRDSLQVQVTADYLSKALPRTEIIWREDGFTVANAVDAIGRILQAIEDRAAGDAPLYVTDAAASILQPDSEADPEEPVYIIAEQPVEPE
jgi:DNA-binding CsgD family transcriptional regulator/transcriptional regulator with XRE-family HTH domain